MNLKLHSAGAAACGAASCFLSVRAHGARLPRNAPENGLLCRNADPFIIFEPAAFRHTASAAAAVSMGATIFSGLGTRTGQV
jgi:hypothetical protein